MSPVRGDVLPELVFVELVFVELVFVELEPVEPEPAMLEPAEPEPTEPTVFVEADAEVDRTVLALFAVTLTAAG